MQAPYRQWPWPRIDFIFFSSTLWGRDVEGNDVIWRSAVHLSTAVLKQLKGKFITNKPQRLIMLPASPQLQPLWASQEYAVSDRSKPWFPLGAIRVQLPEGTHLNSSQDSPMVTAFLHTELRMGRKAVPSSCLGDLMGTRTTYETREWMCLSTQRSHILWHATNG